MTTQRPLTKTQKAYLCEIVESGRLNKGYAGYSSTLTVRILAEQGLINLTTWPNLDRADTWTAQATAAGRLRYEALGGSG